MDSKFQNDFEELELYINNNCNIYTSMLEPAIKRMGRQHKDNAYNSNRAFRLYYQVAAEGARQYNKDIGYTGFNKNCLSKVARELETQSHQEFELGNYIS